MRYLVLEIGLGLGGRNIGLSLIAKLWTMDGEKMVLVRIRVGKPHIAILAFRMIEKVLDMIL
jgi:hypothetical protein